MGRGRSKGVGAGTSTLAISATETIDLSTCPLVYGKKDPALTGAARKSLETFEAKRVTAKIEYSEFVMNDGRVISSNRGGKGSVSAPLSARMTADAMSHNHPRESGIIGGTFSDADLGLWGQFNQTTYRAAAKEGTYSISKNATGFHGRTLVKDYKAYVKAETKKAKQKQKDAISDCANGKISLKQCIDAQVRANNEMLVSYHNFLLNGQQKYGYTYTLERRT